MPVIGRGITGAFDLQVVDLIFVSGEVVVDSGAPTFDAMVADFDGRRAESASIRLNRPGEVAASVEQNASALRLLNSVRNAAHEIDELLLCVVSEIGPAAGIFP